MKCPACGLYHPAHYQQCVSCGTKFASSAQQTDNIQPDADKNHEIRAGVRELRSLATQSLSIAKSKILPNTFGICIAAMILFTSAGITYFFLTKPPEYERLYHQGVKDLSNGQFAFALKALEQALAIKPNDAKVLLALARAYVGVDQVDKAWDCILRAQQLGLGLLAEPTLASELANYYRQHNQYEKAVGLLRPLAQTGIGNTKVELSDFNALWGDESLRQGDLSQALACWEEVRNLRTGSRFLESDKRLATIYQKLGNQMLVRGDNEQALKYYNQLNTMAPTADSYQKTSALYENQQQLELAIDQLKAAIKLSAGASDLNTKLASLMAQRGKELLDVGDTDTGLGYLQQAQALDPKQKTPAVTLRNVKVAVDRSNASVRITGEIWNPGPTPVNYLTLKGVLWDSRNARVISTREQNIIDDFVPPLTMKEAKPIEIVIEVPTKIEPSLEFRIYLDGSLYKSYPLVSKETTEAKGPATTNMSQAKSDNLVPGREPNPAPPSTTSTTTSNEPPTLSPEEKTLKDLDL